MVRHSNGIGEESHSVLTAILYARAGENVMEMSEQYVSE